MQHREQAGCCIEFSVSWISVSNGDLRIISGNDKICQWGENQGRSLSHKCLGADLAGCRAGGAAKTPPLPTPPRAKMATGQQPEPTSIDSSITPHLLHNVRRQSLSLTWVILTAICFELYCAEMGYGSVPRLPIYCGCCQTDLQHITEYLLLFYSSLFYANF